MNKDNCRVGVYMRMLTCVMKIAPIIASVVTILFLGGCVANVSGLQKMHSGYSLTDQQLRRDLQLARGGDGEACYRVHLHFALGINQYAEGEKWLQRSAECGYPIGMYGYGVVMWNKAQKSQEKEAARAWIRKAADRGYNDAVNFLAKS